MDELRKLNENELEQLIAKLDRSAMYIHIPLLRERLEQIQ